MKKKQLNKQEEVSKMVNTFYAKVRKDELIGPIFNTVIKENWPEHIEKLTQFWQSILLGQQNYFGSPFKAHSPMQLKKKHFERWLAIFNQNIDEYFEGEKANEAKKRAKNMATMFESKIAFLNKQRPKEENDLKAFLNKINKTT